MNRAAGLLLLIAFVVPAAACGKKGPPRPPLRLLPAAAADLRAMRRGDDVHVRFVVPSANQGGQGRIDLARLEIYAITVAPGAAEPANRDLLSKRFLAGTVGVKPLPPPEEEHPSAPKGQPAADDTRPAPGETTTFVETLTTDKLEPVTLESAGAAPVPPPPAVVTATPTPPVPAYPRRIYVVRAFTRGGRPGPPSSRVQVPLIDPPPPPSSIQASFTEQAITVTWLPPVASGPDAPGLGFNVYKQGSAVPLNNAPVPEAQFARPGVAFGTEECFAVRTVQTTAGVAIESPASETTCVTPVDTFPPEAPKGLNAVPGASVVSLIWDANTEADLGGYLVLRAEAPGDTLQSITPEPIRETSFRDASVKPGVRYVYAVVAVDRATPPNRSAESPRVEETAR